MDFELRQRQVFPVALLWDRKTPWGIPDQRVVHLPAVSLLFCFWNCPFPFSLQLMACVRSFVICLPWPVKIRQGFEVHICGWLFGTNLGFEDKQQRFWSHNDTQRSHRWALLLCMLEPVCISLCAGRTQFSLLLRCLSRKCSVSCVGRGEELVVFWKFWPIHHCVGYWWTARDSIWTAGTPVSVLWWFFQSCVFPQDCSFRAPVDIFVTQFCQFNTAQFQNNVRVCWYFSATKCSPWFTPRRQNSCCPPGMTPSWRSGTWTSHDRRYRCGETIVCSGSNKVGSEWTEDPQVIFYRSFSDTGMGRGRFVPKVRSTVLLEHEGHVGDENCGCATGETKTLLSTQKTFAMTFVSERIQSSEVQGFCHKMRRAIPVSQFFDTPSPPVLAAGCLHLCLCLFFFCSTTAESVARPSVPNAVKARRPFLWWGTSTTFACVIPASTPSRMKSESIQNKQCWIWAPLWHWTRWF